MDLKVSEILSTHIDDMKYVKKEADGPDFSFTLEKLQKDGLSERLGGLISDITAQGKKLSEHMDISDMKKYRTLIAEFMNEVTTNAHEFSRENFLDKRGRHRVYGIVRTVDEKLNELANELLNSEKDNISILEKTDEIQGLLLNIFI